jgi:hypothetical protein
MIMKKNILMIVVLSLSVVSVAFASAEPFASNLGQEKLSETSLTGVRCELGSKIIAKGGSDSGAASVSARSSAGSARAHSAN